MIGLLKSNKSIVEITKNGEPIKYESLSDAARALKCSVSLISSTCYGDCGTAKGRVFIFESDYNSEIHNEKYFILRIAQFNNYRYRGLNIIEKRKKKRNKYSPQSI